MLLMPPKFQASARVFVDTQNILKPLLSNMTTVPNMEQQVAIMSRTLLSRPNMERLAHMTELDAKADTAKSQEETINKLMNEITIVGKPQDNIYTISYTNPDPKLAKEIVRSLLAIFVESGIGDKRKDSDKAVSFIEEQIKVYEDKLVAAENALKEFKIKNAGLFSRQGSDYGTKLNDLSESLSQAKLELHEAEQARDAIKNRLASIVTASNGARIDNPELDARLQELNRNLDALQLQYTQNHPDIISTKRLIVQLEARKLQEAKSKKTDTGTGFNDNLALQQLNVSLAAAEAKVASLRARVAEYSSRTSALKAMNKAIPEIEAQLSQLNRDYQINKENYEKLLGRREAAKLSGQLTSTSEMMTFRVIDPPMVPLKPSSPNRPLLLAAVFVAAAFCGIGVALAASRLRPTFTTQSSLRQTTGLPLLGAVTMHWTEHQNSNHKKNLHAFSIGCALLVLLYAGAIATTLIRN